MGFGNTLGVIMNGGSVAGDKALHMQAVFNGDQPEHYTESFRLLKMYIEESLDMYKEELQSVLFPIFVHLYLNMIKNNKPNHKEAAKLFFKQERYQFASGGYREDLIALE